MYNVTLEDLERAQRFQSYLDALQAKMEDINENLVKPLLKIIEDLEN